MKNLKQIMTVRPITVSQHTNLFKARMLMAEHRVRHLPVQDSDSGKAIGLVDQRRLLSNAIKIVRQRGFDQLENSEKSMNVSILMDPSVVVLNVNEPIAEAAKQLISRKSGCILVEENERLVGIISSGDFVKLALKG